MSAATARDAEVQPEEPLFPVVGIGASAGGLEAVSALLQALPSDTGMGYVLVQHLDPKHVSLLAKLLQRQTSMPVQDATDGLKVAPNQVYVIPRNMDMTLVSGVLKLSPRLDSVAPHLPIDEFFRSLANDLKSKAIGVILSGSASDGTLGMMAIKEQGGITFTQSSESAKYPSMPRSAVAAGCVDFVLTPKQIAAELVRLGRHPYIVHPPAQEEPENSQLAQEIQRILTILRGATGVDFTYYKQNTMRRRILRRMALQQVDGLDRYAEKLRSDARAVRALYEDVLITVTEFFRDPEVFDVLKTVVFPKIVPAKENTGPIRIWVPGCSSGEEVYSLAIVLLEFLGERSNEVAIQIFGTDISDVALEKARRGMYPPSLLEGVSKERLRRFFTKVDSHYLISKRIREMCVFAKQNLVRDPPFSKLDLLSCRNVLIYLSPVLQNRLAPIFHYALKPNGFLLLGASETIRSPLFLTVDRRNKIYSRHAAADRTPLAFPTEIEDVHRPPAPPVNEDWTDLETAQEADRIVLGRYTPAGVVVDDAFNIVQFRGRTSAFLASPSGAATLNVLQMAREGLAGELRAALLKARQENKPVRRESIRMVHNSQVVPASVEVIPLRRSAGRVGRYLVLFQTVPKAPPAKSTTSKKAASRTSLEHELAAARDYLLAAVEQHESSEEELRSANEEIQSGNEELQSMNEELETAKEELQSTNEELNTVNEELQTRNAQLAQAGNDLLNLLSNVNIPIIMVGNDLRIRRFTPVSQKLLNLIADDLGRPIREVNLNLRVTKLDQMVMEVIESLTPKTLTVQDRDGRSYSLRIRPYRTEDNKIEGAVIVLIDLDTQAAVQSAPDR